MTEDGQRARAAETMEELLWAAVKLAAVQAEAAGRSRIGQKQVEEVRKRENRGRNEVEKLQTMVSGQERAIVELTRQGREGREIVKALAVEARELGVAVRW